MSYELFLFPSGFGACGVRWFGKLLEKGGTPAVYSYLFDHPTQEVVYGVPGSGPGAVLVPHTAELLYVYGDTKAVSPLSPLPKGGPESDLAQEVSSYWYSFAGTGNPNHAGAVEWPAYAEASDTLLRMDVGKEGIRAQSGVRKGACDFQEKNKFKPLQPPRVSQKIQ